MRALLTISCVLFSMPLQAQMFTNVATGLGVGGDKLNVGNGIGGGVGFRDMNGDGMPDLVVTLNEKAPELYIQTATGFALDDTSLLPSNAPFEAFGNVIADVDGDGDPDVLLARLGTNVLLLNQPSGFVDVSATHLPGATRWTMGGAAGDFDGDGDVDIFLANYIGRVGFPEHRCAPNALLVNDGHGRFTDRARELGVEGVGCSLSTAMSDYDNDGDLDLLVVNDFGHFSQPNQLLRNDGPDGADGWLFTDVSEASGFGQRVYGMGLAIGDVDRDGHLDYFSTSIGRPILLIANGDGTFTEMGREYGVDIELEQDGYQVTWGALFEDLDGDGHLDLFASGGHISATQYLKNGQKQPNLLLAGGPGGFVERPSGWKLNDIAANNARGVATGDYNQDGAVDLAVMHANGLLSLYRNDGPGTVTTTLDLRPRYTGSAVGARARATACGETQMRELTGGGSFASTSDGLIRFNFPKPCSIAGQSLTLTVRWPSGWTSAHATTTGSLLELEEPEWLHLEGDTVDVILPGATSFAVTAALATPGDAVSLGDDKWTATLTLPAGGGADIIGLVVDGNPWPVHLRRDWSDQPRTFRTSPQYPILGQPADLLVTLPLVEPGATVTVQVGAFDLPMTLEGQGLWSGDSPFMLEIGDYQLSVHVNGQVYGDKDVLTVYPVFDPDESGAMIGYPAMTIPAYQTEGLQMSVDLRDKNGKPVAASKLDIGLLVDGGLLAEESEVFNNGQALLSYMGGISDGAILQPIAEGLPVGPPSTFDLLADSSGLVKYVSPLRSHCDASMRSMVADGQDILRVLLFLKDDNGSPLPEGPVLPKLISSGVSVVDGAEFWVGDRLEYAIVAGTSVGQVKVGFTWYGLTLPVTCEIELLSPKPAPESLDAFGSVVQASPDEIEAQTDDRSFISLRPRMGTGRLAGSGLNVTATTDLSTVSAVQYLGIGRYEAVLDAGDVPGMATVSFFESAYGFTKDALVTIFPNEDAPIDPGPETPDEVEPAEVEPDEVEPAEVEPDEVEPAEVEPAEVEPAEVEPAEVEPAEVEPAEVEPAEVEPAEVEPAEVEPAEVEPDEVEPGLPDDDVPPEEEPPAEEPQDVPEPPTPGEPMDFPEPAVEVEPSLPEPPIEPAVESEVVAEPPPADVLVPASGAHDLAGGQTEEPGGCSAAPIGRSGHLGLWLLLLWGAICHHRRRSGINHAERLTQH